MPVRYVSADEDNARWADFPYRPGDIVISTRSKTGTTWLQMICALLIFQSDRLPAPLSTLSPWLDRTTTPLADVVAALQAQPHRRFIKTHTPMDGLPIDSSVFYVVAARHPLDAAVSLYHQGDNIDRHRLRQLTGHAEPTRPDPPRPDLRTWLLRWINNDSAPTEHLDGLRGVLWHVTDAWSRRSEPNVILVHYHDLVTDLEGEMQRIAARLEVSIAPERVSQLARAATFDSMRERSDEIAPNSDGVLKDTRAFFRRGRSGAAAEVLNQPELEQYVSRVESLAPADLLRWLHRPPHPV